MMILLLTFSLVINQFTNNILISAQTEAEKSCGVNSTRFCLMDEIFNEYDKTMRPTTKIVNGKPAPVEVKLTLNFMQLLELNAKAESMKTSVYALFEWDDDRFTGVTPEHFSLNKTVFSFGGFPVPVDKIWTPEIYLTNSADGKVDFLPTNALVYGAYIAWAPPAIFKSSCAIKVQYFPYDVQYCNLEFESFYDPDDVKIVPGTSTHALIDCRAFRKNGEWTLLSANLTIDSSTGKTKQIYHLILRREHLFYDINLVTPIVLFFFLSIFEFYLPSESGEKMTLSISILLGQVVFLSLIANCTSTTSENIPLIGLFLLFSMTMVTISVGINVYICNFHFRSSGTHQLTDKMKRILIEKLAPLLNLRRPGKLPDFDEIQNKEISTIDERDNNRFAKNGTPGYLNSTIDQVSYLCKVKEEEENRGSDIDEWHYVAMILDRLMLYIYTFLTIVGTIYFASYIFYDKPDLDVVWKDAENPINPCVAVAPEVPQPVV